VLNSIDSDLDRLVKGTFYTFGSLILVKLIMTLNSIVVARMLMPTNLGLLTILDQISSIVLIIANLGMPLALVKYISELCVVEPREIKKYLSTSFIIVIGSSLTFCMLYSLLNSRIAQFYNEPILGQIIIFSAMTTFAYSIWEMGGAVLRGLQKIKMLSALNVVKWAVIVPVNIFLIRLFGLVGAAMALMICAFVNGVLMLIVVNHHVRKHGFGLSLLSFNTNVTKKLVGYGLPATISAILASFPMWVAVSYLSKVCSFASVGLFRVSFSLMSIIMFIPVALAVPVVPLFSELEKKNRNRMENFFHRCIRLTALVMIPTTVGLAIFSKYIITLLYGAEYYLAWRVLLLFCVGVYFFSLSSIIGYLIAGTGRMWQGSFLNLIWASAFVVLSIILINAFGLNGFGWAYLISYIIHTMISFAYLKIGFGIAVKNIKNLLFIGFVSYCITYLLLTTNGFSEILIFIFSLSFFVVILIFFYTLLSNDEKHILFSLLKIIPGNKAHM